jgi:hypothetical protein
MKFGPSLLLAAATFFIVTFSVRGSFAIEGAEDQVQTPTSHRPAVPPQTTSSDYLGSRACARCHQTDFEQWERSLHVRMTKPIAEATVVGDFSDGTRFADHGRSFVFSRSSGKPTMTVTYGKGPTETFQVDYTLGAKRYQG